jgi:hypothetical protein
LRRVIFVAGLLAFGLGGPAASAERPDGPTPGRCTGATATRDYTADTMTWQLHLDLAGCRWWNGSARDLVMWLGRDDGAGPANRWSMAACDSGPDRKAAHPTGCDVLTSLAHTNPEQAVAYQGEATWKWKDGTHRVAFETHCTTTSDGRAACDDPVSTWHD